ncbi:hypothetical protein OC709_02000 ['Planchonia careya' phytoplasma]|nr:hypothetical protein ['Planchonia careya' phytoplasma]MDO8030275.1 hypothetical protein ['Planchonia careya' phytoplasma]
MLVNQQIELLQTVISYQRPDLKPTLIPLIKIYQKKFNHYPNFKIVKNSTTPLLLLV